MTEDYNTQRPLLQHKEYGRNIKNLTSFVKSIEDKELRTRYAYTLVKLMKQIVPNPELSENDQKYWDDMHIVAGFDMEVDGPYPAPEPETLAKKPEKVPYHNNDVKLRHYGRSMELLIEKACQLEGEEKEKATIYIGRLMKTFHNNWSKDNVDDSVIIKNIDRLSGGRLSVDSEKVAEGNLFESLYRSKGKPRSGNGRRQGQKGQNRNQKNNRQRRRRN